jgi:hypothetical protein
MNRVIVWDIETVPDIEGFAAANGHEGKGDDEIRAAMGDKFPTTNSRPIDPVFRADNVVLAISGEKDGNLRVVYARIGRCQGRSAWRGTRWRGYGCSLTLTVRICRRSALCERLLLRFACAAAE